jgi:hypothetical protein
MKWTTDKPTEPGYYWAKGNHTEVLLSNKSSVIVELFYGAPHGKEDFYCDDGDGAEPLDLLIDSRYYYEFAGPLSPPED